MTESSGFKQIGDTLPSQTAVPLGEAANDTSISPEPIAPLAGLTLLHTLDGASSATWSPDGKLLATFSAGYGSQTVRLWNPKLLYTLGGFDMDFFIISMAWSPDSKWLATVGYDPTLRLWDPTTGKQLHTFKVHRSASVAWSPDSKWLATVDDSDRTVRLWDPTTGKQLHTFKSPIRSVTWPLGGKWQRARKGSSSVAWSPDSKWLATVDYRDRTVRLWDPTTGKLQHTLEYSKDWFTLGATHVAWSPDGKLLASANSYDDRTVRLWDPTAGELLHTLETAVPVAWSPDGKLLASADSHDQTVRLWDPIKGVLLRTLEGHTSLVTSMAWSPDGRLLVSNSKAWPSFGGSSRDSSDADVRIWRTDTWEPVAALTGLKGEADAIWHPHLPLVVTAGQQWGEILIWHLDLERLLQMAPSPETRHYVNAKVVLVGDAGVGKSGLALVLTKQSFAPTDSTHGRHVWLLDQQEEDRPRETREVWLWDLAGQPDYRLIHQLHLHEVTVALIVFDATNNTDPFAGVRHWHRALRQARGPVALPLTILLVAARIDRGRINASRERIEEVVQELGCAGYIETSAKDGRGIAELGQAIRAAIDWTSLPRVTSTHLLQTIKAFVRSEQHVGHLLRTAGDLYDTFIHTPDAPTSSNELRQQFETALRRLEAQGAIRRLDFGNLVLLQPEQLDAYASALLIAVKDESDVGSISEASVQQGKFPVPTEDRLPTPEQEKLLLIAMIDELVRHELALRESGSLLFPSQSTREHPEQTALEGNCVVTFTFTGPVLSIYTTLVVRLAQCGIFQKQEIWQHVVTYTTRLGGAYGLLLTLRGEEQAELGLFFDEATDKEMRFLFEYFVQTHLERHTGGTMQPRRQFVCPACGKIFPKADVTYRRSHGFTFIKCICDTEVSLFDDEQRLAALSASGVKEMEQTADAQRDQESAATIRQGKVFVQKTNQAQLQESEKAAQRIDIYISSASTPEDEMLLNELNKQLSMLTRQPNVFLWEKRLIDPGADWEQEISTYVGEAHLILFLVSPDLLASNQCYKEMEWAMKRRNTNGTSVIPLLMRHTAAWQSTPIGHLEPLPPDRKPIRDRRDRERAISDIAEHIWGAVEKIRQDLANKGS